ncbi:hypothetical protein CSC88_35795, partial [Klebsiella pneumoniae]
MADHSGTLGTQANKMHGSSDATVEKAVIIIVGDRTSEDRAVLAKRPEEQQRSRDPQLQGVRNKPLAIQGHTLQHLHSIITAKAQTASPSVILGIVDDTLLTLQVTLPADNQQQSHNEAESIITTLTIQKLLPRCDGVRFDHRAQSSYTTAHHLPRPSQPPRGD